MAEPRFKVLALKYFISTNMSDPCDDNHRVELVYVYRGEKKEKSFVFVHNPSGRTFANFIFMVEESVKNALEAILNDEGTNEPKL